MFMFFELTSPKKIIKIIFLFRLIYRNTNIFLAKLTKNRSSQYLCKLLPKSMKAILSLENLVDWDNPGKKNYFH